MHKDVVSCREYSLSELLVLARQLADCFMFADLRRARSLVIQIACILGVE